MTRLHAPHSSSTEGPLERQDPDPNNTRSNHRHTHRDDSVSATRRKHYDDGALRGAFPLDTGGTPPDALRKSRKSDSVLSSAVTIPNEDSPLQTFSDCSEGDCGPHGSQLRKLFGERDAAQRPAEISVLSEDCVDESSEDALARALSEASFWKERCAVLEAALQGEDEDSYHTHTPKEGSGSKSGFKDATERTPTRNRNQRNQRSPEGKGTRSRDLVDPQAERGSMSWGGDGGWLVKTETSPGIGSSRGSVGEGRRGGLIIGGHFLSSPVTRSLHKTISDEATEVRHRPSRACTRVHKGCW